MRMENSHKKGRRELTVSFFASRSQVWGLLLPKILPSSPFRVWSAITYFSVSAFSPCTWPLSRSLQLPWVSMVFPYTSLYPVPRHTCLIKHSFIFLKATSVLIFFQPERVCYLTNLAIQSPTQLPKSGIFSEIKRKKPKTPQLYSFFPSSILWKKASSRKKSEVIPFYDSFWWNI